MAREKKSMIGLDPLAWLDEEDVHSRTLTEGSGTEDDAQNVPAAASDAQSPSDLHLHTVQDISKSLALKNEMLALINDHDEIAIQASEVKRIDGSALQLLCALFIYAQHNNLIIRWIKPTDELIKSAGTLGLRKILELN